MLVVSKKQFREETRLLVVSTQLSIQRLNYNVVHPKLMSLTNVTSIHLLLKKQFRYYNVHITQKYLAV